MRRWPIAAIAGLIAVGVITAYFFDVPAVVDALRDWVWRVGRLAPAAYTLLYVAATLLGVPATPLVIVAALLFVAAAFIGWDGWQAYQRYRGGPTTQPETSPARA